MKKISKMKIAKIGRIILSLLIVLVCSSFKQGDVKYYVGRYSGSVDPSLQLDFSVNQFGTKDFHWKHYLYLVKDKDYMMTIMVKNPSVKFKRSMITLEFTDGAKFNAMSAPELSKYSQSVYYFRFSLTHKVSKIGGKARGAKFGINTSGRGAEIAYMLCTVPLKSIKIDDVSLPLENIPSPADYTQIYRMALETYKDSHYFDLLRQCLDYGWPVP